MRTNTYQSCASQIDYSNNSQHNISHINDINAEKSRLRKVLIKRRIKFHQNVDQEIIDERLEFYLKQLLQMCKEYLQRTVQTVCVYLPTGSEIDITGIIDYLLQSGADVFVPVYEEAYGRKLEFVLYDVFREKMQMLERQSYSLHMFKNNFLRDTPDLVLIPVIGFDRFGNRLGRGGGYYDTTLQKMRFSHSPLVSKSSIFCGIVYSCQEVQAIPTLQHDMKLDIILTEKEFVCVI